MDNEHGEMDEEEAWEREDDEASVSETEGRRTGEGDQSGYVSPNPRGARGDCAGGNARRSRRLGESSVAQPARELGALRWRISRQNGGGLRLKVLDPRALVAWSPVPVPGHADARVQRAGRTPMRR
jgi:hypothetical protein